MTWSFRADGNTPIPVGSEADPQPWKAVEEALRDDLAAVLAKEEYGTATWTFAGTYVADQFPPLPPEPPAPETSDETIARLEAEVATLRAAAAAVPAADPAPEPDLAPLDDASLGDDS